MTDSIDTQDEDRESVLVDVLEELTARVHTGEQFDFAEYQSRYPDHIDQIREMTTALEAMAVLRASLPPTREG